MVHYQGVFVSDLQRKQNVADVEAQPQSDWRHWRCLDRWCLGVRHYLVNELTLIKTFFGATQFFRIDNGHYQGVFVSDLQPKQDLEGIVPRSESNW
jgi:hypothetical protein